VHGAPCCVTVRVWPPAVTVALRDAVDVFAVYENVTVPLPDPLPLVTVSQDAFDVAVHAQPVGEVTPTLPVPAEAATDCVVADRVKEHVTPAWVTVNAWPPAVTEADRAVPAAFAVKVNVRVPEPDPLAGDTVSHVWLAEADHVQPDGAVSEKVPDPALAPTEAEVGDSE
jgi:hypothetical protein